MMHRWEAAFQHLATLLVAGTGCVYALMRYLLEPEDPWAVVNHPWQPHVQHLHLLSAPLLVFAAGLIWQRHVALRWRLPASRRRRSGLALVASLVPMVASGYLIQVSVEPAWRQAWVVLHLVSSGLWLAGYLAHQLRHRSAAAAVAGQAGSAHGFGAALDPNEEAG